MFAHLQSWVDRITEAEARATAAENAKRIADRNELRLRGELLHSENLLDQMRHDLDRIRPEAEGMRLTVDSLQAEVEKLRLKNKRLAKALKKAIMKGLL
jgi:predicted  nucleic acid-binding Zn-ribbon protein